MSSKRSQLIAGLKARLETITTAGGYASNIGTTVFVWRKSAVEPSEAPCLLIQDTKVRRQSGKILGQVRNLLRCEVLAVMVGQDDEAARALEEDLIKCLGDWQVSATGLADQLLVLESDINMEPHGQLIGAVQLLIEAEYYTTENQC